MRKLPALALMHPEENVAFEAALAAYRRQTGGMITKSDVIRHGIQQFCAAVGVEWPGTECAAQAEAASPADAPPVEAGDV